MPRLFQRGSSSLGALQVGERGLKFLVQGVSTATGFSVIISSFSFRTYGSGYPGVVGRGTAGRGFPFFFWPIVWPLGAGAGAATYISSDGEVSSNTFITHA